MRGNSRSRVAGSSLEQPRLGSDTYSVTDPHEADDGTKALLRLRSRRLILVESDPIRAEALAGALRHSGATVAIVAGHDGDVEAACALDADAVLVDATELAQGTTPLVQTLRRHPRVRWATVIGVANAELGSDGALDPTLIAVANRVGEAIAPAVELAVRAKGKLPRDTRMEPLGLNRLLRVLADTQRDLCIELSGEWGTAALELGEGRLFVARAHITQCARMLSNAEALAALLELPSAHVRIIESRAEKAARSWNAPMAVALTRAAELRWSHISGEVLMAAVQNEERRPRPSLLPTQPQIALVEAMASAEVDMVAGEEQVRAGRGEEVPDESGSRPRSDLAITREMPLAEVMAAIDATIETGQDAASAGVAAAPARTDRKRGRALLAAGVGVSVLASALLVALALRPESDGTKREVAVASSAGELVKVVQLAPAKLAEAPPSLPATPDTNAGAPLAPDGRTEPLEFDTESDTDTDTDKVRQRPGQLEQARDLVKRARRHRRAGELALAEAAYNKALANFANYPLAFAGLARIALDRKNGAEALRWAEQLVALQPDRAGNQLLLGDAHTMQGHLAEAERAFELAAQLGSKTARKRMKSR